MHELQSIQVYNLGSRKSAQLSVPDVGKKLHPFNSLCSIIECLLYHWCSDNFIHITHIKTSMITKYIDKCAQLTNVFIILIFFKCSMSCSAQRNCQQKHTLS